MLEEKKAFTSIVPPLKSNFSLLYFQKSLNVEDNEILMEKNLENDKISGNLDRIEKRPEFVTVVAP